MSKQFRTYIINIMKKGQMGTEKRLGPFQACSADKAMEFAIDEHKECMGRGIYRVAVCMENGAVACYKVAIP